VHLPGKVDLDWLALNDEQLRILKVIRHPRKLRRGVHRGNQFTLCLSQCEGDLADVEKRLQLMAENGFANYFGEQRFGYGGQNIQQAKRWFAGEFKPKKSQRGIYLSAARSWLFNYVLAKRVTEGSWNQLLTGELLMLDGTHSVFAADNDPALQQRMEQGDLHATGPMYGKPSALACSDEVAELEEQVLKEFPELLAGLEQQGLKAERRALRVIPQQLSWQINDDALMVNFFLPSGCFATALVRELMHYHDASQRVSGQAANNKTRSDV
jgi:tRNA pseudouridine13 synthase